MEFNNKAVADRFVMAGDKDQHIEIPGRYKGNLSEVHDPAIIEGMLKRKSNLVAEKSGTTAKVTAGQNPKQTP